MTIDGIFLVLGIFGLRVVNTALGTIRVVVLTRDRRLLAFILGFIESLLFALTLGIVVNDLTSWPNLLAYAGGFAVGNYMGLLIESRFIRGYMTVQVVYSEVDHEMATALRQQGFGVTETFGEGGQGAVTMLRLVVLRRMLPKLIRTIQALNPAAFITVEEARAVHRGWMRAARLPK